MKNKLLILGTIVLNLGCAIAYAGTALDTEDQKFSYAIGAQFGQTINSQVMDLDVDAFLLGLRDMLTKTDLKLSPADMQQVMLAYREKAMQKMAEAAKVNKLAGEKFLAENKTKKGVSETESGLQYKIIQQGEGKKPLPTDEIVVHYRGTLIDGTEFDSSYARGEPVTLKLSQVIQAWQEALPMMSTGAKWQIYVPSQLGYGERGAGNEIGPNSALIFDIELIAIN